MMEKKDNTAPDKRMQRMQRMFTRTRAILAEDYDYFTGRDASMHPNTIARTSEELHGPPSLKPS